MKPEKTPFKQRFLAGLICRVYSLIGATFRVKWVNGDRRFATRDRGESVIFAHWHQDDLAMVYPNRDLGLYVMVSLSKDGALMANALSRLGYQPVRGSSSRGGARGLIQMIRGIRDGGGGIITIDGPRGPRYKAKPGIIALAQKTGAPIVVGGAVASRKLIFKGSWSKVYLPLPFSRVVMGFSQESFSVPSDADEAVRGAIRLDIETALHDLHAELSTYL